MRVGLLLMLGLICGLLVQIGITAAPAAAATGNIVAPFTQGERWYVYQGYNSGTHTGTSQYGLDLTLGTSTTSTAGKVVRAPMAGTIYYWDSPYGNLCVNTPNGRSYTLTHINASKTSGAVSPGEALGTVAAAGQRGNNNVAHLHVEFWSGPGCYNKSTPIPFDAAHGLRMCGAPDMTPNGPSAGNGVWSGTYFTAEPCVNGSDPTGQFDELTSPEPGTVRVRGWAFDPDAKTTPINVHVYIGGPAGSGAPGYDIGSANGSRPDVGKAYPGVGDFHGYDKTLETSQSGSVSVYVYAINAGGTGGGNTLIGSRAVAVRSGNPNGSFDGATSTTPGKIRISGWAVDPNKLKAPVGMHLYVGGPAGSPSAIGYDIGLADDVRRDVGAAFPGVGNNHGYERQVRIQQSGTFDVYLYALDLAGTPGDNVLLGSRRLTVLAAPQPMTSTVAPKINGRPRLGSKVTTDGGSWSQANVRLGYQWFRGDKKIRGATQRTHVLRKGDVGHRLSVRVTAVKGGYTTARSWSPRTRTIAPGR